MQKFTFTICFLLLSITCNTAFCQESFGGIPFSETNHTITTDIPVWTLPAVNTLLEDSKGESQRKGEAFRYGIAESVNLSMTNAGRTDIMANGDKVWRIGFQSKGCYAMSFDFSKFKIPEGAELYIYNEDYSFILGKFTSANMMEGDIFFTQAIAGDQIFIEYFEPADATFEGSIELKDVNLCYKDVFKEISGAIGSAQGKCHPDVTCPAGEGWRDQINSVVCISYKEGRYYYLCSGAMINNTNKDRRKYVYSAGHCYSSEVSNWIFYFNYQVNKCGGTYGNYNNTAAGAVMRAVGYLDDNSADFLLLEITGELSASFRDSIYFAGWTRFTSTPTVGACIHHPGGDWKKISIPKSVGFNSLKNKFWEVSWKTSDNQGTTEQGSSGSPLFNANHLIVGSLSHGTSSCSYIDAYSIGPAGKDYYGKFNYAWTNGNVTSNAAKLQPWLAPNSPATMSLPGMYYNNSSSIRDTDTEIPTLNIFPNPTSGPVTIKGEFDDAQGQLRIFNLVGELIWEEQIDLHSTINADVSHLQNGVYILEINSKNTFHRNKLIIAQ